MRISPRYFAFLILWKTGESQFFARQSLESKVWITTLLDKVVAKEVDKVVSIRVDLKTR